MDRTYAESGAAGHVLFLPGGMVHSGKAGDVGVDQLDVFWPVRPDYVDRAKKQQALYEQIVAPGETPKKLADGFTFTEGPTWLKGKLYFSDMWFKNPAAGDWTGSPAHSRLIVMEPDGRYRVLARGMQSNGTIAATQRQPDRLRHVRSPRRRSGPGHRPRGARAARQDQRQADRRPQRSGDGRERRLLHHRSAVHPRGEEESARQAGLLPGRRTARRASSSGRANTRCRTASSSRPTARRST